MVQPRLVKRVGVVGGGQLAWMMGPAAQALGLDLVVQTPQQSDPAVAIATQAILAPVTDPQGTAALAQQCDIITFENEFVDLPALQALAAKGTVFYPQLNVLALVLDKFDQRSYFDRIGLPNPRFVSLNSEADLPDLATFAAAVGFPLVLKTRRLGYDGYGTFILKTLDDLQATWQRLDYPPVLIEEFVPFTHELAVMVARSEAGEVAIYPTVETQQVNQVCRRVFAPAAVSPDVEAQVQRIARTLVDQLQAVGIIGIEFFLTPEGKVLINEIAPRTHNSGHYTLDACATSQFEQQLRAVSGLPLGPVSLTCPRAVMVNLLGFESASSDYADQRKALSHLPHSHVYWYGKTQSRSGRKLGHVTVCLELGEDPAAVVQSVEALWYPNPAIKC
ncbi:5-(carboxyamino)imidazole ribonucleotide synthase [Pseudanabaena sp. FACHB-2040]|uniref:5-(carboxyamino)imidazole ribonucleotide synthase n=1 Tax=Pseudanabaena sp. FACHB-2040 TaxID=2692859 RepID=UPI001682F057|nr:5-(carboxyamino)imidazole ribonucleotide synthase [Pseudanabaena sp. FACHB-2040]MBD2258721.1 5-(carboxyamino)imidazole ribonucleotide synthase [Pseudanabaena sp. FACHB-2040]